MTSSTHDGEQQADPQIRVLIVDDHLMVAEGIALSLRRHADINVVQLVSSGPEALATVEAEAISVVLMDYALAEGTGVDVAAVIRERHPETAVLMVSGSMDEPALLEAIEAGACGMVSKTDGGDELVTHIRRAAAGELLVSPELMRRLMTLRRERDTRRSLVARYDLTAREKEVLVCMGQGLENAAIAEALAISYHTVRGHVQAILQKLEAGSRLEAVTRARSLNLLDS